MLLAMTPATCAGEPVEQAPTATGVEPQPDRDGVVMS
jgi:hypothetical protein